MPDQAAFLPARKELLGGKASSTVIHAILKIETKRTSEQDLSPGGTGCTGEGGKGGALVSSSTNGDNDGEGNVRVSMNLPIRGFARRNTRLPALDPCGAP